ncbi:hypothetical protein E4179_22355 [Citrobacter freundii]|uniref:hypothetical protein n=1 Tax=Citrobacter freundii TaxID=546 RepID=UPI000ADC3565|nr:hypothetical protein [Citrobacter freundii]QGJ42872.1 hypothetical protein E4179_22355 [Citrobacter freundii]QGJ48188.1 hypothetical protein E4177_22240 [Citrobacter freundii]QGJ50944.1 hypothetical protein E4174_08535 [Citrobacter freundii]
MRPIKRLYLSGEEIPLVDSNLVLELSAGGRGFITAVTAEDYTGKLVRLDIGYPEMMYRWFTGYVERSQPAENGSVKLFVRELVGTLDRQVPCSFRHPTLRIITDWLGSHSGLMFTLPTGAGYTDKPIAHFTHAGTGWQLLASLGRAFSIPDYVWYQLPDGNMFTGSYAHSLLAGKPVVIPAEFNQATAAGDSMTIPMVPTLRPGAMVNGQRITMVRLMNDDMLLTWTPLDAGGKPVSKPLIQRQMEKAFPELAGGLHVPRRAVVIAHSEPVSSGNIANEFRPRYAVDLQLQDADGNPVPDTPVYKAVPVPVPMAGHDSGQFQFPPVGTLVEVAFMDGRPDKPFIRQTLPDGTSLPDVKPGEQLQQQREGVSSRVTVEGHMQRTTDQTIAETSMHREVKADTEQRTITQRDTVIHAADTTKVMGPAKLLAGAIQQASTGDYAIGTQANYVAHVGQNATTEIGGNQSVKVTGNINTEAAALTEKIAGLRKSVAAAGQQVMGPTVHIGSENVNALQMLLETIDLVKELATACASHTHPSTGTPTNATSFTGTATKAGDTRTKYQGIIA